MQHKIKNKVFTTKKQFPIYLLNFPNYFLKFELIMQRPELKV